MVSNEKMVEIVEWLLMVSWLAMDFLPVRPPFAQNHSFVLPTKPPHQVKPLIFGIRWNATHGCHSPMNVPKRCRGIQTRPDRLGGEPRQGEPFHALTPLAPTRVDFSEVSSQNLQDRAAFHCCECHAWKPLADECS